MTKKPTFLSRLRVGQQLGSAFVLLALLAALMGGLSLWAMGRVNAQTDLLARKWLVGVGNLSDLRATLTEARDLEVKHSRTDDASYHSEYEDKIKALLAKGSEHLSAYAAKADTDEERNTLAKLEKGSKAYAAAVQKVIKLGRDKAQQDAADISDGLASMAYDETQGAITALMQHNFAGGEAAQQAAATVYVQSRWGVVGGLAATVLAALGAGLLITRNLLRQLGGEPVQAVAMAAAVAQGRLDNRLVLRPGDTSSLMAQLMLMQSALADAVQRVRRGAEQVATASAEIAHGNQDLSSRTENQASALQQTAATMEELGQTVHSNADNARQANQLASAASGVAVRGGEVVSEVVDTMKGINESSRKVVDIISVIDGIAFQTNILALNAAVEAARAGEQGRGFAVVAGEVRSLAQRSAEAAKEIKALISASVERVEHGSALVDRAGQTMDEVVASIRRVTDIVGEISSASAEQSSGVSQVGDAIGQMDRNTQQNAALVEQSAAAAESLRQQSTQLVDAVAVFRLAGDTTHPA